MRDLLKSILFLFLIASTSANAQNYFQQEVNYKINVKLDDEKHALIAYETIEYINNSSDELNYILFHIWPNAYRNNSTVLGKQKFDSNGKYYLFTNDEQQGYIDSLNFKINGADVKWEIDSEHIDICKIFLSEPLKPGEKVTISTPFYLKIPKGNSSRLGHMDQAYCLTQWYPKPAVYDKFGWHAFPYLNMGEFYSEFGSFDVSITLPENYVVAATGNLQTESEIEWINQKVKETELINNFDKEDNKIPTSSNNYKTVRFTEENIHDFAWFTDKRYHVLQSEVELPNSKRKVKSWVYFRNDQADVWVKATEYINDALHYYSLWYGDYPYNNCSAISVPRGARGGGMEYPTITAIGFNKRDFPLEMVIMHEVGHNWFYGILGFNERRYPWMDEGINTFSDMRYMEAKYEGKDELYKMVMDEKPAKLIGFKGYPYKTMHEIMYLLNARMNEDQAANLHSAEYIQSNYGGIVYSKAGLAVEQLKNYLEEDKFNEIMQAFFEEWKFKHPYPDDLQKHFEKNTNKDLSWFFEDLITTTKKVDYKIKRIEDNKVLVKNKGNVNSPVQITGIQNNSEIFTLWNEGFDGEKWLEIPNKEVDVIALDPKHKTLELYRSNNYLKTKGLFNKIEPLDIRFLGVLEKSGKSSLNIIPAMGWNFYNGFMAGIVLHNGIIPPKKFSYQLMPLYGFHNNDFAGSGKIAYQLFFDHSIIDNINLSLAGTQFAYSKNAGDNYQRYKSEIKFQFRKDSDLSKTYKYFTLNNYYVSDLVDIQSLSNPNLKWFQEIEYSQMNTRKINPYHFNIGLEISDNFVKSSFDANYKISYYKKRGLDIRLFGGAFLSKSDNLSNVYNFQLSGRSGNTDYLYNDLYLGRVEDVNDPGKTIPLAQQFTKNEGGFTTYSTLGQSDEWMVALNLTSSFPFDFLKKVKPYANFAVFGNTLDVAGFDNSESIAYEAGIKVEVINNIFDVYFPVIASKDITDYNKSITDNYLEKIRFTLNINKLNVFNLTRNINKTL